MKDFFVAFAGQTVLIRFESGRVGSFLTLLFGEMQSLDSAHSPASVLEVITGNDDLGRLTLCENGEFCAAGSLGVSFAAVVFDRVMFHLLRDNDSGVALHAGAVARDRRVLLIPGQSGAGKSTLTAWLTSRGFTYLTDELVFLPAAEPRRTHSFTRPLSIKPGARETVKAMLAGTDAGGVLEDDHGMIVPHRAINPSFLPVELPPSVLLFPAYRPGASLVVERLSRARAGAHLMACDVNGRNLADHGFGQLMAVARSAPAYRLVYGSFDRLEETISTLLSERSGHP